MATAAKSGYPSKRRPVNKTFSGCARCKASKVKCDEAKPSCSRCNSRGVPCPGYRGVVRWSTKHEMYNTFKDMEATSTPQSRKSKAHLISPPHQKDGIPLHGTCLHPVYDDIFSCDPELSENSLECGFSSKGDDVFCDGELSVMSMQSSTTDIRPIVKSDFSISMKMFDSPNAADKSVIDRRMSTDTSLISLGLVSPSMSWSSNVRHHKKRHQQSELSTNLSNPWASSIPSTLDNTSAMLVSYYFKDVCSVFSSFDSELNPFRSYVAQVFQYSAPVFNAMQSSSAARLADKMPHLKIVGLQYQSQALRSISESLKETNNIPEDTLFAIFLLGLSTAWHDGKDIGLAHFYAAQQAISSKSISVRGSNRSMIDFFKDALIYWEMAITLVSDDVGINNSDIRNNIEDHTIMGSQNFHGPNSIRVVPHPWTGVSSSVQSLFGRVSMLIRALRSLESRNPHSDPDIFTYLKLIEDAKHLELSLWSIKLPNIADIDDAGDCNTPAFHHLLLAEAYIFGALYQIYRKFPDVLIRHRDSLSMRTLLGHLPSNNPLQEWQQSLPQGSSSNTWLQSLGANIILRLQQIPITSGTRSVQAILMFVAAGSLSLSSQLDTNLVLEEGVKSQQRTVTQPGHDLQIIQWRDFTISRLSSLRKMIHSRPVDLMQKVIKEIYRRLDTGEDVFWIDIVHEMNCETMLG